MTWMCPNGSDESSEMMMNEGVQIGAMMKNKNKHKPRIKNGRAVVLSKHLANTYTLKWSDPRADRAPLGSQSDYM